MTKKKQYVWINVYERMGELSPDVELRPTKSEADRINKVIISDAEFERVSRIKVEIKKGVWDE